MCIQPPGIQPPAGVETEGMQFHDYIIATASPFVIILQIVPIRVNCCKSMLLSVTKVS